ncbi:PREDICTED: protein UPSTREAM OF FLC-like [Camelina sativa]|uniref:Protein UPSTREAM OF FLC-like n=1 Tax=Camelina sativa TaxID=90675 RepID=A0ABM0YMG7_CAMSA|nr:PREDICTED: protein UPSTREAM OF FLC-like [Camelina sativa]
MALMSSRATTTQDNFIIDPSRMNHHKLDSKPKVSVVYYLSRNGQLDHPHFIEVPLSSQNGLYLKDVINRLNELRGKGMACLYSWSSKRTYKNGFVWHDLSEEDFIFPVHGQEYVLKGSQILDLDNSNSGKESNFSAVVTHRRNQSWSSTDQYKVYKASAESSSLMLAADASTQTDDHRRRRKHIAKEVDDEVNEITELSREEITSPPQSDSSPETLESLMKADGRLVLRQEDRTVEKMRPSAVLMQLLSCGAMSFRKCGPTTMLMNGSTRRSTVERGTGSYRLERAEKELRSFGRVKLEEKEYFSGSLIDESKKELVPALMRSSSCNTDRSSRMGLPKQKDGEESGSVEKPEVCGRRP